jgi:hypothetical protein
MEQLICSSPEVQLNIVAFLSENPELAGKLKPKNADKDLNINEFLYRKLCHNSFNLNDGETVGLGIDCSTFQHCCDNNAGTYFARDGEHHLFHFIEIYAMKDILENQEVTISYHYQYGHELSKVSYVCPCKKSLMSRKYRYFTENKLVDKYADQPFSGQLLQDYVCKNILEVFRVYLISKGLNIGKDGVAVYVAPDLCKIGLLTYYDETHTKLMSTGSESEIRQLFKDEKKSFLKKMRKSKIVKLYKEQFGELVNFEITEIK